jgi:hypothetical protein
MQEKENLTNIIQIAVDANGRVTALCADSSVWVNAERGWVCINEGNGKELDRTMSCSCLRIY